MPLPRIAYISSSRIPGRAANAVQVMKMVNALMALGYEIALTAIGNNKEERASLKSLYGVPEIPAQFSRLPSEGRFGIYIYAWRAVLQARRLKVDIVFTRSIIVAALASRLGIATIFECHAPPQRIEKIFWRLILRAAAFKRLVLISHALHRIMLERFPETAHLDVVVAHDGVDIARFQELPDSEIAKKAAGLPPAKLIAGYAGHLYPGRGTNIILHCAAALPEWHFLIAGGTSGDIARVQAEARDLGLSNVEFIGFIDNAELAKRLAVCDTLLMPYQRSVMVSGNRLDTVQWMSPLKMFEYMAMKRAIVSSDLPVLREVLDESTAVFAAPDESSEWIAALQKLADKSQRDRLADQAFQKVADYDWQVRAQKILAGV